MWTTDIYLFILHVSEMESFIHLCDCSELLHVVYTSIAVFIQYPINHKRGPIKSDAQYPDNFGY